MAVSLSMQRFLKSAEAKLIRAELQSMVADTGYSTRSSYSPTSEGPLSFVDKHMMYLSLHTSVNSKHYISNLRLMTKISP